MPVFSQSIRLVCADRRTGRSDRTGRRGVPASSSDAWHRFRCEIGRTAEPDDQSGYLVVRDDQPQRGRFIGRDRPAPARSRRARDGRHGERGLWREARPEIERRAPRPAGRSSAHCDRHTAVGGSRISGSVRVPAAGERHGSSTERRHNRRRHRSGKQRARGGRG